VSGDASYHWHRHSWVIHRRLPCALGPSRAVAWQQLIRDQHGLLDTDQLRLLGIGPGVVAANLEAQRWRRVLPRVYATFTGPLIREARITGALLYGGPAAVLSHTTAAEEWRMIALDPLAVLHAIATGSTRHHEIRDVIRADPTRLLEAWSSSGWSSVSNRSPRRGEPGGASTASPTTSWRSTSTSSPATAPRSKRGWVQRFCRCCSTPWTIIRERWEAAFREHVRRLAAVGEFGDQVVAVGPFWTAEGHSEIDVVALAGRARTPVLVGEAKWAREVSAP